MSTKKSIFKKKFKRGKEKEKEKSTNNNKETKKTESIDLGKQNEIEERFEIVIKNLNLDQTTLEKMRSWPLEKKQILVSQQKNLKVQKSIEEYIQMLFTSTPDLKEITSLRVELTNSSTSWITDFVTAGGHRLLLELLQTALDTNYEENYILEIYRATKSLMNNMAGYTSVLEHEDSIRILALGIKCKKKEVLIICMELLAAISTLSDWNDNVRESILDIHEEDYRIPYTYILPLLFYSNDEDLKTSVMTLLNGLTTHEDISVRTEVRFQLLEKGMSQWLFEIDRKKGSTLTNLIEIFEQNMRQDNSELNQSYGTSDINVFSPGKIFEDLQNLIEDDDETAELPLNICRMLIFLIYKAHYPLREVLSSINDVLLYCVDNWEDQPDFRKLYFSKVGAPDQNKINEKINLYKLRIEELEEKSENETQIFRYILKQVQVFYSLKVRKIKETSEIEKRVELTKNKYVTIVNELENHIKQMKYYGVSPQQNGSSGDNNIIDIGGSGMKLPLNLGGGGSGGIPPPPNLGGGGGGGSGGIPPPPNLGGGGSGGIPPPPNMGGGGSGGIPPPPNFGGGGGSGGGIPPPPNFGGGGGLPPPPNFNGPRKPKTPKSNLVGLNWKKLPNNLTNKGYWSKMSLDGIKFDQNDFKAMFKKKSRVDLKKKKQTVPTKISLIAPKKSSNVEIVIKNFKMKESKIAEAILKLDEKILTEDITRSLILQLPTTEEAKMIQGYKGKTSDLSLCEKFYIEILKINRLEQRLRSYLFKISFDETIENLEPSLRYLQQSCNDLKKNKNFKIIIQIVLQMGNMMNGGSFRGDAAGFDLSILSKLKDTKSTKNKEITLLNYIATLLERQYPETLNILDSLNIYDKASKTDLMNTKSTINILNKNINVVENEIKIINENNTKMPNDKYIKKMMPFLSYAKKNYNRINDLFNKIEKEFFDTAEFFGVDKSKETPITFFTIIRDFLVDFKQAIEKNHKVIEEEEKKKKLEERKAKRLKEKNIKATEKKTSEEDNGQGVMDNLILKMRTGEAFKLKKNTSNEEERSEDEIEDDYDQKNQENHQKQKNPNKNSENNNNSESLRFRSIRRNRNNSRQNNKRIRKIRINRFRKK
ncbi:protein diaphanous [Anaeramoeba flamelloides]|uniref:Protein diaphanous n=1 Tax=Anaeramoeba flamelloides TaxID=1746091 RepID=A0AAV7YKP0_9EUKA|nr:protein diaphanous [Anaeramoeba flamelloides]